MPWPGLTPAQANWFGHANDNALVVHLKPHLLMTIHALAGTVDRVEACVLNTHIVTKDLAVRPNTFPSFGSTC